MTKIEWDKKKNDYLKKTRNISFEDVMSAIDKNKILDIVDHHNPKKHPNQKILIVEINSYAFLIPFVQNSEKIFFKTIIPNSKATKNYILKTKNEKNQV